MMLNFFPEIYPDELWYSVLCRYHIRSGNMQYIHTMQDLFGDRKNYPAIGSLFPNNSIHSICEQLPNGLFDKKSIILKNTLFQYFSRMRTVEEKIKMLERLEHGTSEIPISLWRTSTKKDNSLKYCPLCKKEEIEKYGESYWHCSHQIPLIQVCKKHKCKLVAFHYTRNDLLNESFILPNRIESDEPINYNSSEDEIFFSDVLYDYAYLPLEMGQTPSYNNLWDELVASKYGHTYKLDTRSIHVSKIKEDLEQKFDSDLLNHLFGSDIKLCKFDVIKDWSLKSPGRYALIATLIKQPARITFGRKLKMKESDNEKLHKKLIHLVKDSGEKGIIYKKKYVANFLGITTQQLDMLSVKYKIVPFWSQENKEVRQRTCCYLTKKEKEKMVKFAQENHYASVSDFMRFCIQKEFE